MKGGPKSSLTCRPFLHRALHLENLLQKVGQASAFCNTYLQLAAHFFVTIQVLCWENSFCCNVVR